MSMLRYWERMLPEEWRFERRKERIRKRYRPRLEEAREEGDSDRVRMLNHEIDEQMWALEEERRVRLTKKLLKRARKLDVPVPDQRADGHELTSYWRQSHITGDLYLTKLGVAEIRENIREEERWRMERRKHWATWLNATTGAVGALTGLVAVLLSLQ